MKSFFVRPAALAVLTLTAGSVFAGGEAVAPNAAAEEERILKEFGRGLERLRRHLGIPGMAGVVRGHRLIWAKGFGFADMEKEEPVLLENDAEGKFRYLSVCDRIQGRRFRYDAQVVARKNQPREAKRSPSL
jgi:hypothetical protein